MDWTNEHFHQTTTLAAPRDAVIEAARRFAQESLAGWNRRDTDMGFELHGTSGNHEATAHVKFGSVTNGTSVDIELVVRRSSPFGYMLFDAFGYYDTLVRKWLWGIWKNVAEPHAAPLPPNAVAPHAPLGAKVVVVDAQGTTYIGVVKSEKDHSVLVAYDAGGEGWVPAAAVHVVEK